MTMTEQEMTEVLEEAKEWLHAPATLSSVGRSYVTKLLEIIEYQKGVGLVAWSENETLKKANELLGRMGASS